MSFGAYGASAPLAGPSPAPAADAAGRVKSRRPDELQTVGQIVGQIREGKHLCACCASPRYRFDSLAGIIAQTFGIAVDRTRALCETAPRHVRTHIWSAEADVHVPSLDFSATDALISAAYRETKRRLATSGWEASEAAAG